MIDVSRRAQAIRPFVVMDVVARAKELEAAGRDIVRLEIGDPDFPTPRVIAAACESAIEEGTTHYTQSLGLPDLRHAIREDYLAKYDVVIDPENVMVIFKDTPWENWSFGGGRLIHT